LTTEAHVNHHAHDAERDAVAGHGAVAVNANANDRADVR
jgi:hypothetical protein